MATWQEVLGKTRSKEHLAWLKRGRNGAGRLDVAKAELSNFRIVGNDWTGARFVECRFVDCRIAMTDLLEAELVDCTFENAEIESCHMEGARLRGCRMTKVSLVLAYLERTRFEGCNLDGVNLARGSFTRAVLRDTTFRGARLVDTVLDDVELSGCDLSGADLRRLDTLLTLASARRTRFVACDLRDTRWAGRALAATVFDGCKVAGITGGAKIESPLQVTAPDFSPAGDGSDVRDAQSLIAALGAA